MKFYQFFFNYYTDLHHRIRLRNQIISSLLIIYSYIQFLGIVIQPKQYGTQDINTMMNLLNIFSSLSQIGRPYQFLIQYQQFRLYSCLLPAIVAVLFKIDLIIEFFHHFNTDNRKEVQSQQNQYQNQFRNFYSYLLQVYEFTFKLLFLDLCSLAIKEIYLGEVNLGIAIFASFWFLFYIAFNIFNLQCSETQSFPCLPLQLESFTLRHVMCVLLTAFNLLISQINNNLCQTLSQLINCLILLIYLKNEIYRISTIYNFSSILLLTFSLSYCLTKIFFLFNEDNTYQLVIVIILCPLLANLLMDIQQRIHKLKIEKNRNIEAIYNNLTIAFEIEEKNIQSFELLLFKQSRDKCNFLDQFTLELVNFNSKIMQIDKYMKGFWYKKYVIIKNSQDQYAETLSLIENFVNGYLFDEVSNQFNKTQVVKSTTLMLQFNNLKYQTQKQLHQKITLFDKKELNLLSEYINQKSQNNSLLKQIKELFQEKQSIYQKFVENNFTNQGEMFDQIFNLTKKSISITQLLTNQYKYQKTQRLQQLLTFLNIEFCNNIIQAERLKFNQVLSEFRQLELEAMEYLVIEVDNDMKNLSICQYSSKMAETLGYKNHASEGLKFQRLLAADFQEFHQQLVFEYLTVGQFGLLNNQRQFFIRGESNYYQQFNVIIHISPRTETLQFYAFTLQIENQPPVIILNNKQIIIGYTRPAIQMLKEEIFERYLELFSLNINEIFNNFPQINQLNQYGILNLHIRGTNVILPATLVYSKTLYYLNFSDIEEQDQTQPLTSKVKVPTISAESIVVVPNELFCENLNSPLSIDRKKVTLIKSETYLENHFLTKRSKESEKHSTQQMGLNRKISITLEKNTEQQNERYDNDKASSKYTKGFLDNSMFYQKYNILNDFLYSEKQSPRYKFAMIFIILGLSAHILYQFVVIFLTLPKFERVNVDTDILAIKSYFMTPIHNCVTAQVCVVDYIILGDLTKEIPIELAYEKLQFGLDSINQTYFQLKNSFTKQLNNKNLESFFLDSNIGMVQIDNLSLPIRNLSFKTALYQYLEAQYYISTRNYYEVLNFLPTNDFVYYMSNIITLDNYFDQLNTDTSEFVMNRIDQMKSEITKIVMKFCALELFCIFLAFSFTLKYYTICGRFFKLISKMNVMAIQKEGLKLKKMLQVLQSQNFFQDYSYELYEREKQIKLFQPSYNLNNTLKYIKNQQFTFRNSLYYYLIGFVLYFVLPQVVLNIVNTNFCNKYKASSILLNQTSFTSSAITAIYEIREINYMISAGVPFFYFLTDEKLVEQNNKVIEELEILNEFIESYPVINLQLTLIYQRSDLLIDSSFQTIYESMKSENLCDFLINFSQKLSAEHCELIYSGVMKLGLFNTLNEIHKEIQNEYYNSNGFQAKLRNKTAAFEEIEIGLIASDVILFIQKQILNGILNQTQILTTVHFVIIFNIISQLMLFSQQLIYVQLFLSFNTHGLNFKNILKLQNI